MDYETADFVSVVNLVPYIIHLQNIMVVKYSAVKKALNVKVDIRQRLFVVTVRMLC